MKVFKAIVIIIALAILCGYVYIRIKLNNDKQPTGLRAAESKVPEKESILDLRPKLIEKLQQLVQKGSKGLYHITIKKAEPDLLESKIDLLDVHFFPDSMALSRLDQNKEAPDDVFKASFRSLHIDGIGIKDLLSKERIDLRRIFITDPVIEVYHRKRAYNKNKREDSSTLYQQLMEQMKSISVDEIVIQKGTLNSRNMNSNKTVRFNEVAIHLKNILIDSSTQYDKTRFLFAKTADISFKNFTLPTIDNLYWLKAGAVSISATKQKIVAAKVSLLPRGTKQQFQRKLRHRQVMYTVAIPELNLSAINWWNLFNSEGLLADELNIKNAKCTIYLDRSLPPAKKSPNDFPHQLLTRILVPVKVDRLNLKNATILYQEYNPLSKNTGAVHLNKLNVTVTNLTNRPAVMEQNTRTKLTASAIFMHKARLKANFQFDLAKIKTGVFTANIEMGALDHATVNPIAEPMGLFSMKKGNLQKATANIQGNNYSAKGKVLVLYDDLHITPLKPAGSDSTDIKKKHLTSFIANTFMIKNDNPSKGETPRSPDAAFNRIEGSDLFNLVWKTMLVGTLKTIGINPKMANP